MATLVCDQDLLSHQLLKLIFAQFLVVLLSHLLLCGTYLRNGVVLPQYFAILALLDQPVVLNFAVLVREGLLTLIVVLEGYALLFLD